MRIKRYILTSLIEAFFGTLAVLYGVMFIIQWIRIGRLISIKDLDLLLLVLVPMSVFVIPMALIFSTLLVLERLSIESEIIAMKACGVRSRTIYAPVIFISVVAMLIHGFISTYLGPISMRTIESRIMQDAPQRAIAFLKEREFDDTFKDIIVHIESVNQKKRKFTGVFIETSGKEHAVITAEKGTIDATPGAIMMKLKNGSMFMSTKSTDRYLSFGEYVFTIEADLNRQFQIRTYDTATQPEFKRMIREKSTPKRIKEYHNRISFPVLNLILGLVGISFGIVRPRSPKFTGFVVGLGTIVGYYLVFVLSDRMVRGEIMDPVLAAWIPNAFFCLVLLAVWAIRRLRFSEGGT